MYAKSAVGSQKRSSRDVKPEDEGASATAVERVTPQSCRIKVQ